MYDPKSSTAGKFRGLLRHKDTLLQILTDEKESAAQAQVQYSSGMVNGYLAVDKICMRGDVHKSNITTDEIEADKRRVDLCIPQMEMLLVS